MKCLSLDFGGSSVKAAIIDEQGEMRMLPSSEAPLKDKDAFRKCVAAYVAEAEEAEGISISLPGYIDPKTGVLEGSGVYESLWGENIPDLLKEFGLPVFVENDGNCGALAESWLGSLKDCWDGAVIILGTGVGGGIIKDGKIHHGRNQASGELSYMILHAGEYGFLNSTVGSIGMIGMTYKMCRALGLDLSAQDAGDILKAIDSMDENSPLKNKELKKIKADGRQMFAWLEEGNEKIEKIYKEFIQDLAAMVNNIQVVYAPEKIAIGGGLSKQKRLITDLKTELKRYYDSMGIGKQLQADVVSCEFLQETNLIGAARNFFLRTETKGGNRS